MSRVFVVRDGALQPVAVFTTQAKAWSYIDQLGPRSNGWDVEEFIIDTPPA